VTINGLFDIEDTPIGQARCLPANMTTAMHLCCIRAADRA